MLSAPTALAASGASARWLQVFSLPVSHPEFLSHPTVSFTCLFNNVAGTTKHLHSFSIMSSVRWNCLVVTFLRAKQLELLQIAAEYGDLSLKGGLSVSGKDWSQKAIPADSEGSHFGKYSFLWKTDLDLSLVLELCQKHGFRSLWWLAFKGRQFCYFFEIFFSIGEKYIVRFFVLYFFLIFLLAIIYFLF